MRISVVGTYPPTRCGIATFTADVQHALEPHGARVEVIQVDPVVKPPDLPSIVSSDPASYSAAADWLNVQDIEAVLIEHEFGIHGGPAGANLLELTSRLRMPYVLTLHTILAQFTAQQYSVLQALCDRAAAVTVFTQTARRMVVEQELARNSSVYVVPHGAPLELFNVRDSGCLRNEISVRPEQPVISTFGLLSPGKGIGASLVAMRDVVDAIPDARYVIAGRTHPGVQRNNGESYRRHLERMVVRIGLRDQVTFLDRFLDITEIAELLAMTRVFVTPYANEEQIVSGALTFALAAGCPVVSTPYRYACDVVPDASGILVPFGDATALARGVVTLCQEGPARDAALERTARLGGSLSWPAVGRTLLAVVRKAIERSSGTKVDILRSTTPNTNHLFVLFDDTSVMQHADHKLPRLEEGYCVDDAARLLPIAARYAHDDSADGRWSGVVPRLLSFIDSAAHDGHGLSRNFMSWDHRWLDEPHGGDHVERAVWGLGELVSDEGHRDAAVTLLDTLLLRPLDRLWSREIAYRSLGLLSASDHIDVELELVMLHRIIRCWRPRPGNPDWEWPERRLTYDNFRLPEAMIRLGHHIGDDALVARGIECCLWLEARCRQGDFYRFPGHLGMTPGDQIDVTGDEQPLEAAALIDAAVTVYELTGADWGRSTARRAWSWFLGNNRAQRAPGSLVDGSCHDGVLEDGLNLNCGAESTISFHRAASAIERLQQLEADRKQHVPT